ncbi:hypothetical protein D918_08662 [Trichuris suis]|nr:hypothetical protein D918_08662 [Trichuris suis]
MFEALLAPTGRKDRDSQKCLPALLINVPDRRKLMNGWLLALSRAPTTGCPGGIWLIALVTSNLATIEDVPLKNSLVVPSGKALSLSFGQHATIMEMVRIDAVEEVVDAGPNFDFSLLPLSEAVPPPVRNGNLIGSPLKYRRLGKFARTATRNGKG